ncbi:hypothetical protein LGH82_32895 [Mesorhizobium sp. PAMC28654]|uniref:hypothetical protein n=1 Tax=Mesorhizobium sp. PAMC28654 TaxID=2880934 RepID=UPI001D0B6F02|nr:hypothetical protein [Mesorhizobium sp. PAMC28654]UDL89783.1 hypothetical protein LGH82_32895 [Mesorhizobium sp. PAMC28654]
MCFCFDGESAVAAYRPDGCRERLPAVRGFASPLNASAGALFQPGAKRSSEQGDGEHSRRLAVVLG